ncbi:MAG: AI-2E family transporter [Anaerolineaceae bacterium]|nr:AI-2E family transporter [Anaerolineaceae bacterium]
MIKTVVRVGLAILTTIMAIVIFWQFRTAVIYVLISLILAASVRPLFTRLIGKKIIIRILWILVYFVVIFGLSTLLKFTVQTAATELQSIADGVSAQDKWTLLLWSNSSGLQSLFARLPTPSVLFQAIIGNEGELVGPALLGIVQGIGGMIAAIAIILVLSVYWSMSQIHFERLWLSLLPPDHRKQVRSIWRKIETTIGQYVRGQILHSILVGITLGLGYWLIGSSSPALLALVGTIGSLIPVVGLFLVVFTTMLLGLLTSAQLSLFTVLYTIVILTALGIWVKPRLINRQWDNPILTLLIMVALADALGIIGIIIAPLLSVVCQILWSLMIRRRTKTIPANLLSDLQERMAHLRETVDEMEEPHSPLITSSIERITELLDDAEPVLKAGLMLDE